MATKTFIITSVVPGKSGVSANGKKWQKFTVSGTEPDGNRLQFDTFDGTWKAHIAQEVTAETSVNARGYPQLPDYNIAVKIEAHAPNTSQENGHGVPVSPMLGDRLMLLESRLDEILRILKFHFTEAL